MRSLKPERKSPISGRGVRSRASPRTSRASQTSRSRANGRVIVRGRLLSSLVDALKLWVRSKRPLLVFCVVLAVLVSVIALFAGGYVHRAGRAAQRAADALVDGAGFGIHNIRISGNARVPAAQIVAALGLAHGQSIFGADLRAARARLMALDWVADADVRRRYPDSIDVSIVEKLPFALWQSPHGLFVIERSGGVITGKNISAFAKLPKFAGAGGNQGADVADAIAVHRALNARVVIIDRVGERRWNLILDDGVVVKLPEKNWQKQLDALEHLIVDKGILERNISEIDLRSPSHYFFVLKQAQKKDDGGKQI